MTLDLPEQPLDAARAAAMQPHMSRLLEKINEVLAADNIPCSILECAVLHSCKQRRLVFTLDVSHCVRIAGFTLYRSARGGPAIGEPTHLCGGMYFDREPVVFLQRSVRVAIRDLLSAAFNEAVHLASGTTSAL